MFTHLTLVVGVGMIVAVGIVVGFGVLAFIGPEPKMTYEGKVNGLFSIKVGPRGTGSDEPTTPPGGQEVDANGRREDPPDEGVPPNRTGDIPKT